MKTKNEKKIFIIIFIVALLIDQITKIVAYIYGLNIASNIDENGTYYNIISIVMLLLVIRYVSNQNAYIKMDTKVILTILMSGIAGNFIDRIWNKKVITFITLGKTIHFNFAYIYILIAWIGLTFILSKNSMAILKERKMKGKVNESKENKNK